MTRYHLMHKNIPCAEMEISDDGTIIDAVCRCNPEHLPIGTVKNGALDLTHLRHWWNSRSIPAGRSGLNRFFESLGIMDAKALITKSMGLSLSDQYWVRRIGDRVEWEEVNFFDNPFSSDIGDLLFGIPTSGELDLSSPDNTSDGILRKRWTIIEGERYLMKSGSDPWYQEPLNEVVSTIIMDSQGIPNAGYGLVWEGCRPCSICRDFIDRDTELVTASHLLRTVDSPRNGPYRDGYEAICSDLGIDIRTSMGMMDLVDHVMMNTDRHHGNHGLIRRADTLEWVGAAPIYDTGTSLMCRNLTPFIIRAIPGANNDMTVDNRIFHADLEWLDVDAMLDTLPVIEGMLSDAADRMADLGVTRERSDAIVSLLERRMMGIADMMLRRSLGLLLVLY